MKMNSQTPEKLCATGKTGEVVNMQWAVLLTAGVSLHPCQEAKNHVWKSAGLGLSTGAANRTLASSLTPSGPLKFSCFIYGICKMSRALPCWLLVALL